jgi:transposase
VVAAIGNGAAFTQGRDFGAWLGLVPKQESTGDHTILGKISKRGNKYLRTLFVQAAHVVLARRPNAAMRGLWPFESGSLIAIQAAVRAGVGIATLLPGNVEGAS